MLLALRMRHEDDRGVSGLFTKVIQALGHPGLSMTPKSTGLLFSLILPFAPWQLLFHQKHL